jgi:hypothetical protein
VFYGYGLCSFPADVGLFYYTVQLPANLPQQIESRGLLSNQHAQQRKNIFLFFFFFPVAYFHDDMAQLLLPSRSAMAAHDLAGQCSWTIRSFI